MSMHDDIKNVLVSEEELKAKVRELGAQISRDYEGKNLVLVIRLDVSLAAAGFVQDGADLHGIGVAHLEHGHQVEEGDARVQNVLHDQHHPGQTQPPQG